MQPMLPTNFDRQSASSKALLLFLINSIQGFWDTSHPRMRGSTRFSAHSTVLSSYPSVQAAPARMRLQDSLRRLHKTRHHSEVCSTPKNSICEDPETRRRGEHVRPPTTFIIAADFLDSNLPSLLAQVRILDTRLDRVESILTRMHAAPPISNWVSPCR